jgi:hypothetical protein
VLERERDTEGGVRMGGVGDDNEERRRLILKRRIEASSRTKKRARVEPECV